MTALFSKICGSLAAGLLLADSPIQIKFINNASTLDNAMQTYFANPADQASYNKALKASYGIIQENSRNSLCSVHVFGITQILQGMPIFINASNKNILMLKSSKEESIAQTGLGSSKKWDEIISASQIEFQKGMAFRGEMIGNYMQIVHQSCNGGLWSKFTPNIGKALKLGR
ncbi:hypothetical protein [Prochlorococcus marinus]|uniref:hypothetical protein n=1 Tax=Prochlorococcus marinus TaxID=1219 RepID=UPI0022B50FCC|nr:hypothetical protein [Prochlorococcus marinus]